VYVVYLSIEVIQSLAPESKKGTIHEIPRFLFLTKQDKGGNLSGCENRPITSYGDFMTGPVAHQD
jgi:hypothetical protein